jgi:predicted acyltransferase
MSDYSRDRQLDMLRGIAVMGMFFYSVVGTLSRNLPPTLEHNVIGKLRLGDFVLSLFLFSSGISLALANQPLEKYREATRDYAVRFRVHHSIFDRNLWRHG